MHVTPDDQIVHRFPPQFLWGTSTSSHQVEGDNSGNDWWEFEQAGRVPFQSGRACDHYRLFERDFDLARAFGHNVHRFSIEWSRVEPAQGEWNPEAIAHYAAVIGALRARGLEPVVTLHHFTNPAWFSRRGGWERADSPGLFARYVAHVVGSLGAHVQYWLTLNEPTVYVIQGYVLGEWPPCLKGAWTKAAAVFVNLARAHRAAYRTIHRLRPESKVSFAHSAPVIEPCNPRRGRDRLAAALRHFALNRAFFSLIGARTFVRPASLDFVGLNYYSRTIVRSEGPLLTALIGRTCEEGHHARGAISATGWEVYPAGLKASLQTFAAYGLPILVTENGVATDDDSVRRDFIVRHLESLSAALQTGVEVFGYCYWSLIDNFEWALGTRPRFGLVAVDFETQERHPRLSARLFEQACRTNGVPSATVD